MNDKENIIGFVKKSNGGITPSGEIEITENGTYDVTDKASAVVNVSGGNDGVITPNTLAISAKATYNGGAI